ncbi:hypothetical protein B0H67DRAFT_486818 [Lasiosphaeris hirsuta]|uniref:Phosphatidate phosphatase APP1 catalytic domain-containing protein n=1 Tax=Lasiosphaeris hirsuta TaxID=260670 RepID=A0AA40E1S4_9PEZI|nr:hypothetical protein B0H67DRAFT_486818 [Lasiosphaeris hirsuta]
MTSDATSLESQTRSERGFVDTEASLVSIGSAKISGANKLRGLLSFLGPNNPLPAPITKHDVVWLMDNVAYRGSGGAWHAEFVSATFEGDISAKLVDIVGDIAGCVGLSKGDEEEAIIERRIVPFVRDVLPGRQVKVDIHTQDTGRLRIGPGGRNGISSDVKKIPTPVDSSVVLSTADVPEGAQGLLEMKTVFAEPEGWAIISDIDDTIKITQTSDPVGILRSTFISEPAPVPGMPELYAYLQTLVTAEAPWFYLSASPYNLYPFLREFRDGHFPHGQLILRDANLMTIPGLLSNLTLGTQQYKVDRIKKVNRWLPKRKMIFIGDSTQSDPEAYGEIYRTYPGWVKLILIRKVTDVASVGKEEKNVPARFEAAFAGIPRDTWHIFEDPSECQPLLHKATSS